MTTHSYKLLMIDIDGTLVNRDGDISIQNREALSLARSSGIIVSISTGRSLNSSLDIIDQLSLDSYHIFFDGALASSPETGEEIYARPIDEASVDRMIEYSHEHDIDLELYSTSQYFAERETWSTEAHRDFFGVEPVIGSFSTIRERERIIKGALVVTNTEEESKATDFMEYFSDRLDFSQIKVPTFPDVTFINILSPGTSKGKTLEALTSHLGISLDEVMAVGDGKNDISLLTTAGLGVAMGNAHEEVKKIADYITLHVEEYGLAAAIRKFLI